MHFLSLVLKKAHYFADNNSSLLGGVCLMITHRIKLSDTRKGRFPLGVFLLADEKTKEKKLAERKRS